MKSFIRQVLEKLLKEETPISDIIFVLPSKRAGAFLLNELSMLSSESIFAPKIYSIEEFAEEVSGLKSIDNTTTLFEFYEVYQKLTSKEELENFETFLAWAQSLIHDFNEIDRYLIDAEKFFDYLADIQDINHWSKQNRTELIENYLKFWAQLPQYYQVLKENLVAKEHGYQGLIYRAAATKIPEYASENANHNYVFLGFNALNSAEQIIFQELLEKQLATVYWDIDNVFLKDYHHEASLFIREYLKDWPFYQENPLNPDIEEYSKEKDISITGIPKNVGQAKYLAELLADKSEAELEKTAIVLGDESLLLPILNSLPPNVKDLNITMGFPLKNAPVTSLFNSLFDLHTKSGSSYYYRNVIAIVNHPSLHQILKPYASKFIQNINKENTVYLKLEDIQDNFPDDIKEFIGWCFNDWKNSAKIAIENFQNIVFSIKNILKEEQTSKLQLEFLYHFHKLFNQLQTLNNTYPHINSLTALRNFYNEIMSTQSLDFQGRPFKGLQLMGMLESRALDFENVIITSVNEGTLPSGKSNNSFIPYDLKKSYNLPTYREKDAVYTYHFYRLLQRAKKVTLLYNTESGGLNSGEKSRFLTQLEIEKQPKHELKINTVSPKVPKVNTELKVIEKTPAMIEKLKSLANYGFSPSALTTYIRNPLDFYYQYVLGVKEEEEVEETVAYNTLGTVIHDSLEEFYQPLEGQVLTEAHILDFRKRIGKEVATQFQKTYTKSPILQGKNYLIFEIAKRYLSNFFDLESNRLKNGEEIKIVKIEKNLKTKIVVPELNFPIYIKGKVDRVENCNGITRIIDYKTGKVDQSKIEIVDWENITTDYDKYSKSFQVLAYATMMKNEENISLPLEGGIISFKNLKSGLLKFAKREKPRGGSKDFSISEDTFTAYQDQLKKLITEICNPAIPFTEKEI
ncbi:PD-(D/E)XK nuclease family protein [Zunongwangia sp. HGR-M22]|uniref:PD-(D/E)XK nuclease family protein n=1 Tax=Zunongwangia sp. HGR-M22 TaxID=3015168 RepID=UPI0022DD04D4|nr:PD-(D/E)XK nuclease family protein [Zunongwangia sp. HGR-M22]WBL25814.1 PD-(D/E)XK nuclease family protein [Zunongwangia sp. HGR-M22]